MKLETPNSAAAIREQWDANAAGWDEHVTPVTMSLGERLLCRADVHPGMRVLDIATGSGAVALPAARLGADVVAVDLSPAMIDRLTTRASAAGITNLEAMAMDGTALDLPEGSFDLAISLNGVSTFADLDAGLAEMVRVTRDGGRVLVAGSGPPQRVGFVVYFLAALQAAVPGFESPPMDPPLLPLQVADPAALRSRLVDVGVANVQVDTVMWGMHFTSATHLWGFLTSSPLGSNVTSLLSAEQRMAVRDVLDGMLRECSGGGAAAALDIELNIGTGTA